jgi:hypothetical protein
VSNLTPQQVVETLTQIGKEIDAGTDDLHRLDEESVRARAAYKRAFAESFLRSEGSMDIRRYTAELATADLFLEMELSEQRMRAVTSHLKALRDRLEIGRSLGPLIRLEWGQS